MRKPLINTGKLFGGGFDPVNFVTQGPPVRQGLHVPADMLARSAQTGEFAIKAVVIREVVQQQFAHFFPSWGRQLLAGFQKMIDFTKNPGASLGCAANHDRIGPGVSEYLARFFGTIDVTIGHDRNRQTGFDGADGVVFGSAFIHVFPGATMQNQG